MLLSKCAVCNSKNQNFLKNKNLKDYGIVLNISRILLLNSSNLTGTKVPILNECNSKQVFKIRKKKEILQ